MVPHTVLTQYRKNRRCPEDRGDLDPMQSECTCIAGRTCKGHVWERLSLLTLCAECGLVSALHATGGGSLVAVSVVAGDGPRLLPCGRCRQLLIEAGGPGLLLDTDAGPTELGRLLPSPFTRADLAAAGDGDG